MNEDELKTTMNEYDELMLQMKELEAKKEHIKLKIQNYMNINNHEIIEREDGSKWKYTEMKGRKSLNKDLVIKNLKDDITIDACYVEGTPKKAIRFYNATQVNAGKLKGMAEAMVKE